MILRIRAGKSWCRQRAVETPRVFSELDDHRRFVAPWDQHLEKNGSRRGLGLDGRRSKCNDALGASVALH